MGIQWLILITILILLIQTFIFRRWGLAHIQYARFFNQHAVFEGEEIEMVEQISNKKLLPIPWLRLEAKISANLQFEKQFELDINNEQFHRSLFSLMPYQKITRRHKATAAKRGHYSLDSVAITSGDPFGFGEAHQTVNVSAEILVYPMLIPMENIPLPSHSWQGDMIVRRWIVEDPFVTAGVREYSYGDSMSTVNWKATARTGTMQVSKRDYTADHHLMIYLNFDLTEDIWMPIRDEALIERGISYAASIAQYAISQGIGTGFGCNSYLDRPDKKLVRIKESVRINPQNSKSHLTYLFETMAKLKMDRSMNFNHFFEEDVNRNRNNTDILLITSFVSEKMQQHIRQLENQGNAVEILWLIPEDQTVTHDEHAGEGEQHVQ
jgi:hypothetical protein